MARRPPREGVPPGRAIAAVAQYPPAVLRVDNAGSTEVNGFYKENGAQTPMNAHCTPLQCVGLIVATGAQGRPMARRGIARCEFCKKDTRAESACASKVQVVTLAMCDAPRSRYTTLCNEQIGNDTYRIGCARRLLLHKTQRNQEIEKIPDTWSCAGGLAVCLRCLGSSL